MPPVEEQQPAQKPAPAWSEKVEENVKKDSRAQPWKTMFTEEVNNKVDRAPDFTVLEPGQPMTNGVAG
jgi:hypothetical protein